MLEQPCQSVGKYHTHTHTQGLSMSFEKQGNETSARQIFIGSFPTPSFILPLLLSSVHLTNIMSWFMEMSRRDPALRNTTTADRTTTLFMCFIIMTICYTHCVLQLCFCKTQCRCHLRGLWTNSQTCFSGGLLLQFCNTPNNNVYLWRIWCIQNQK